MGSIEPSQEGFRALVAAAAEPENADAPILMLNLLRFREQADYPDDFDAEPCSGAAAYERYGAEAKQYLDKVGGRPILAGPARIPVIAPEGESWDAMFVVRYPSRQAFLDMATDPGYLAIVPHRSAALSDSRLILCDDVGDAPEVFGLP